MRTGDFRYKRSTQLVDSDNVWENPTIISPFGIAMVARMPNWQSFRLAIAIRARPIARKSSPSNDLLFTSRGTARPASKLL
jgi:hypothetical protein